MVASCAVSSASLRAEEGSCDAPAAAGEDHLFDAGIGTDGVDGFAPLSGSGGFLGVWEMAAEAVAAVHRAAAGGDQQRAPVVLADDAGGGPGGGIADRVHAESGHRPQFFVQRQDLAQQRVVGVAMTHPCDESARHAQRELSCSFGRHPWHAAFQSEQREQFPRVADRIAP